MKFSSDKWYMKLLTNKYFIALAVFLGLMFFFDSRNDVISQYERRAELKKLQKSKAYYEEEIEKTRKDLIELQNNTDALEKVAREKFKMKKPNEDIFLVQ